MDTEVLKILIWPVAVCITILLIILILHGTIKKLLSKVTKLKYGETVAELGQLQQDVGSNQLVNNTQKDLPNKNVLKALALFSDATVDDAKSVVLKESNYQNLKTPDEKLDALIQYSQVLNIILGYERTYNQIFGSQIFIIDILNSGKKPKIDLKRYYDNAAAQYPEFYKTYGYDEYFEFLEEAQLVTVDDNGIAAITWFGRDFLKFMIETARPLAKRY